jgi:histidinol dehydrogenase
LAKKYVFGEVAIDAIAGPSEVVVIADATARAEWVAADLIAQAEHAPGASILVTWTEELLEATALALERQLDALPRGALARQSLEEFGALVLVRDADEAVRVTNELAPEHVQIVTARPEWLLGQIRHAGAVFLGQNSPVALGDYVAGPSHVLPTGGTARFASGLSANDFLRGGSVICFESADVAEVAEDLGRMADIEGLAGHRRSVTARVADGGTP